MIDRFFRTMLAAMTLGTLAAGLGGSRASEAPPGARGTADCAYAVMNVVAHQDDDFVFFGAAEIEDIAAGACVRTVYLTTGDAETAAGLWTDRETGSVFAHETMAGERHKPSRDEALAVAGRRIAMRTLARNDRVSLVFLRLPGGGVALRRGPSLAMLWTGAIDSIATVEGAADDGLATRQSYTRSTLVATLYKLMAQFKPDRIRIQNFKDAPLDGAHGAIDHPDHVAAALFAYEAAGAYAPRLATPLADVVTGYRGYETSGYVQNLSGPTLAAKLAAFADYARFDRSVCADPLDCAAYRQGRSGQGYSRWLAREYPIDAARPRLLAAELRASDGRCVAARGGGAASEPCAADDDQDWSYDPAPGLIAAPDGARCLAADGASAAIRPCDPRNASQRWSLSEDGEALNAGSGRCLTTSMIGGAMTLSPCVYGPRQLFGYGQDPIRPVAHALVGLGDRCLTMDAGPGARASTRRCAGTAPSRWYFTPSGTLRGGPGGQCLGAERGGGNRAAVTGQVCVRYELTQLWSYDPATGAIQGRSGGPTARQCLEAHSVEGAAVSAVDCDGSEAQKWAVDSD